MNTAYKETIKFLFRSLPMYQRDGTAAYKADLGNTINLDKALGHPHRRFKSIHIAGTNGKGSVSHMLASVFQEAGYKTGLYTSPHLLDFRERIRINGSMISESDVVNFVRKIRPEIDRLKPSFFEMTVAMAFDHFAKEKVDIAIIETGLGGRLDSTNILTPELSLITNVSMDHMQFLGNTIEEIAGEKAGIIKNNTPIVVGKNNSIALNRIIAKAREKNAPLVDATKDREFTFQTITSASTSIFHFKNDRLQKSESWECDLLGTYQAENIQTTLAAIDALNMQKWGINQDKILLGIKNTAKNTKLRGRWEVLGANPRIICDTAHNIAGVKMISQQLQKLAHKTLHIVWGMVNDKSIEDILALLPKDAIFYFSEPSISRKMPSSQLLNSALTIGMIAKSFPNIETAIKAAQDNARSEDTIYIGGSTFVVAEALPLFQ